MVIHKAAATVFTPLDDGTGVLLNLDTLLYFTLNRTGAHLWKLLEEVQSVSLDDLVMLTCERFEVSEAQARMSLLAFVDRLDNFHMIRLA
ncbi:MAG: PqqD family protein [Acidobacteria bacterium]|nr:PqqD family protein [Acidobacteriota bacterium]